MEPVVHATVVGAGASRGIARGPARWVRSAADALAAPPGAVLLAEWLPAGWVPLLAAPAAVAIARGGALANAATALRERGVPAVFGLGGELAAIPDGRVVEVDGAAGIVRAGPTAGER